jgi:hypothetical protein
MIIDKNIFTGFTFSEGEIRNPSEEHGAAISLIGEADIYFSTANITNNRFSGIISPLVLGAAVGAVSINKINIKDNIFSDCLADKGGAVYLKDSIEVRIYNSELIRCKASSRGGSFYLENVVSLADINNMLGSDIGADSSGGVIYFLNVKALTVVNFKFERIYSPEGGVFWLDLIENGTVSNGSVKHLLAVNGGFFMVYSVNITIERVSGYNASTQKGGLILSGIRNANLFLRFIIVEAFQSNSSGAVLYTSTVDLLMVQNITCINSILQGLGKGCISIFGFSKKLETKGFYFIKINKDFFSKLKKRKKIKT